MFNTSGLHIVIILVVIGLVGAALVSKPTGGNSSGAAASADGHPDELPDHPAASAHRMKNTPIHDDSGDLIDMDYSDAIQKMGLEDEVVTSHKRFITELNHKTSTASKDTVLDSFNPPVPWHGLPRKAMFARLGADRGARVVQSETPDQTLDYALHNSSNYCL